MQKKTKRMDSDQDADLWLDCILNSFFWPQIQTCLPTPPQHGRLTTSSTYMGSDHSAMLPAAPPCENNAPTRFEFKSGTAPEEVKASSVPKNTAHCT